MNCFGPTHGSRPKRYLLNDEASVPAWIRIRNRVQAVSRHRASHFLVDIFPEDVGKRYGGGMCTYIAIRTTTYATRGLLVRLNGVYALYAHIETPATSLSVGFQRQASIAYSQVNGACYNTPTVWTLS